MNSVTLFSTVESELFLGPTLNLDTYLSVTIDFKFYIIKFKEQIRLESCIISIHFLN
jgi:hypothetical protein